MKSSLVVEVDVAEVEVDAVVVAVEEAARVREVGSHHPRVVLALRHGQLLGSQRDPVLAVEALALAAFPRLALGLEVVRRSPVPGPAVALRALVLQVVLAPVADCQDKGPALDSVRGAAQQGET